MALISRPIDMLGINFYTRQMVGAIEGEREARGPATAMDWEIHPSALGDLLRGLHEAHHFPRYLITENGAAMPDNVRVDGRVIDTDRLEYIAGHLGQVHQAMEDGVPVEGYFRVVAARQLRVGPRVRPEVRAGRRRHGDPAPHAEAERPVVRRGRPHRRDTAGRLAASGLSAFAEADLGSDGATPAGQRVDAPAHVPQLPAHLEAEPIAVCRGARSREER